MQSSQHSHALNTRRSFRRTTISRAIFFSRSLGFIATLTNGKLIVISATCLRASRPRAV